MSPNTDPDEYAGTLLQARGAGRLLDAGAAPALTLDDAYVVQRRLTALRTARGERIVGWKLGYTSVAMREQMGVAEPNLGPLTDAMALPTGATVPGTELQPRVEPEIGLRLARRLEPPCTVDDVLAACASAVACLEVVDSVWAGYRFRLEDNTADGSSAAWFVTGDELPLDALAAVEVRLYAGPDGRTETARATGAAAGGHPALGVAWLAEQVVARYGRPLEAGDLVLTGGLTVAVPLGPGTWVRAEFLAPVDGSGRPSRPVTVEVTRGG